MSRTVNAASGHTLHVAPIPAGALPIEISDIDSAAFSKFYEVRNWDKTGAVMMYLAKGHRDAPNQVCVFYRNSGKLWASFGTNFQTAIDGAQRDGWMYA